MTTDAKDPWFSVSKAHLYFPGRIASSTVRNWISKGIPSKTSGKQVYLKTKQVGGRLFTSMASYNRFIQELNGEDQ